MSWLAPDLYERWRAGSPIRVALREGRPNDPPPERLLQQIWRHQRLRRDALRTLDGQSVTVLHPGFWNREAGPDFRQAVVQFGTDEPRSGDVEVDLRPDAWRLHHHAANPTYKHVCLHVVWESDGAMTSGLPTLTLRGNLDAPLTELQNWLDGNTASLLPATVRGRCTEAVATLPTGALHALLEQAARCRLRAKASRFSARAREVGWEPACWEGLFEALGYKQNVWPMRRIAELRPHLLEGLVSPSQDLLTLQARLLGVAGLLPVADPPIPPNPYVRRLWDGWWREREAFAEFVLPRSLWRFYGLRPANRPERRLALAAHWLGREGFLRQVETWATTSIPDDALVSTLMDCFHTDPDEYWSWHWTLRSPRLPAARPFLGAARVTDLAVNVVLPWLWSRAEAGQHSALQASLEHRYLVWPAAQDNARLRLARLRLLGGRGERLPARAALQQGILQISRDFCEQTNALCDDCPMPDWLHDLHTEPTAGPKAE